MSDEQKEEHQEINMENKLGTIRVANVKAFMAKKKMSAKEFATIAGVGYGTVTNCFGNGKRHNAPSSKTMERIYKAFDEIAAGSLDKADFNPRDTPVVPSILANKPAIIPQEIFVQVGRLKTPVSESMAKRVLIMIALEDDE